MLFVLFPIHEGALVSICAIFAEGYGPLVSSDKESTNREQNRLGNA